jgi:hypothetical protein
MSNYYFLLCLLPPLPAALGEKISIPFGEISAVVRRHTHAEHQELVNAPLRGLDAFNWEQMDQGRDLFLEGGLLSREDLSGNRDIPDFITKFREEKERGIARPYAYDRLWEIYYDYAFDVARNSGCRFLTDYLSWEIELRTTLAAMRVREKGANYDDHAILGDFQTWDYSALVAQLKSQKNPLTAERYLDEERLRHIYSFEGTLTFTVDALLAYLMRSAIYSRWGKISEDFDIETYLWQGGSM